MGAAPAVLEVAPPPSSNPMRWLYDAYTQTQKLRIAIGNRIGAVERGTDEAPLSRSIAKLYLDLKDAERSLQKDMAAAVAEHPAWPWLSRIKGIGPTLGCKVLALIDIEQSPNVTNLWRFAGLAVFNGQRERPKAAACPDCGARGRRKAHHCPVTGETVEVKGEKLPYCIPLKTTLFLIAGSFLKANSPYRRFYDTAREKYAAREAAKPKGERWTKGHQHAAALRKMEKMFLSHLWEVWRTAEGLPLRKAYVFEQLGHTGYVDPWEMVEPE